MATLKCKMCGGDLSFVEGQTVCECEYCGSKQTIPSADNEKKITLFGRAGRLLRACEFDKAAGIFESIIVDFPEEAEAYWGLVLCKYGIEYVDDPATGKKVPTCHRSSFESVMDDDDFEQACENADALARSQYRTEAKELEELRRSIIEVSSNEKPYDIFISYKERDESGERTIDSVIAQDVYEALIEKGYRVFFSRISLEDKLGIEYEPYIFAALNSAKVMLAFGTSFDYYNAVWVKNEWSRFLKLMAADKSKHLIPCFKDIDAYDMPKEFAKLAAQDMGKVGAQQDLIRGIDKLLNKIENTSDIKNQTVIQQVVSTGPNVDALLKRGYDSLEDGAFDEAKSYFDEVLNSNAQSGDAYLGLFMAEIKAANMPAAKSKYVAGDYAENRYWKRAKQYAEELVSDTLNQWDFEREIRLLRETEKEKMDREEANRKAREAEEERRIKLRKVKALQEQLNTVEYQRTSELYEIIQLRTLISSKKIQLECLGIFKSKEKRELQAQIDTLESAFTNSKKIVTEKSTEIESLEIQINDLKKQAGEFEKEYRDNKQVSVRERLFRMLLDSDLTSIKFGSYNGANPIEWNVVDSSEKGILLLSRYALDTVQYNSENIDLSWENSSLRRWLNNTFLNDAFDNVEKNLIATTIVKADKNPKYNSESGIDTQDKIFLLSAVEVERFLPSEYAKQCKPTAYAKKRGCYVESNGNCWWWLRSTGKLNNCAAVVTKGSINYCGIEANIESGTVRPACWINLNP